MNKTVRKSIALFLIFILTVINYGVPIKAIAIDTMGSSSSLFGQKKLEFKAYFDDVDTIDSKNVNVNDRVTITAEIKPKANTLFQDGILEFKVKSGLKNNFKIVSLIDTDTNEEKISNYTNHEQDKNIPDETTVQEMEPIKDINQNESLNNTEIQNQETTVNEIESITDTSVINEESETTVVEVTEIEHKKFDGSAIVETNSKEVNTNIDYIKFEDITQPKKYKIVLEYLQGKTTNIGDLSGGINLTLKGKVYDEALNVQDVSLNKELKLVWTYNKDTELLSNYTIVSPFNYNKKGTILQQEIEIKRDITNIKYLPLNETRLIVDVPQLNGINASQITVEAKSLMATSGDQYGQSFTKNNWSYNSENNTIEIKVSNGNGAIAINTCGSDYYTITYRYDEFVEEKELQISNKVKLFAEEVNGVEFNKQEKVINTIQNIVVKEKNLVSVSPLSNSTLINKSSINANYYLKNQYKAEFKTSINVNIIAADILEDITIVGNEELYQDSDNKEFNAIQDVKYN